MDRHDPAAAHAQSIREYREWRDQLTPIPSRSSAAPTARRTPRPHPTTRSRLACVYCGNRARGGQLTCWLHADLDHTA
jgi:hypothetical protein